MVNPCPVKSIRHQDLRKLTKQIFMSSGSDEDEADLVSEYLVRSNLCGVDSHGVIRIPDYVRMVDDGRLRPNVIPRVVSSRGATARIDARLGYGQVSGKMAMELAIKKAKRYGTGTVAVYNGNHVGRLAEYTLMAAEEDMIGIMMIKAYGTIVAPWGARSGLLSTSPISFAFPGSRHEPVVGDFATSVSAEGKVRVRYNRGEKVPPGWLLDASGKPTENPGDLYKGGVLLTFGQWKGYALNLLMEAAGGALTGAGVLESFTGLNGVLAMALNIEFFTDVDDFKNRIDSMIEQIRALPPISGVDEVLLPGDPESREMQKRLRSGIPIEEKTWERIVRVARRYDIEVPKLK